MGSKIALKQDFLCFKWNVDCPSIPQPWAAKIEAKSVLAQECGCKATFHCGSGCWNGTHPQETAKDLAAGWFFCLPWRSRTQR